MFIGEVHLYIFLECRCLKIDVRNQVAWNSNVLRAKQNRKFKSSPLQPVANLVSIAAPIKEFKMKIGCDLQQDQMKWIYRLQSTAIFSLVQQLMILQRVGLWKLLLGRMHTEDMVYCLASQTNQDGRNMISMRFMLNQEDQDHESRPILALLPKKSRVDSATTL
ncbi:hypothetical protein OIU74_007941 [Salix koriyanagi]|uniref:Uncharacterized protein n=1 Tax=Salix koriyanagi TaxID=2511006 RepID=A0A9Q0U4W6_9ROSI|nr:hypothetical protein OIU74_007941 [Salix koriyanagi]